MKYRGVVYVGNQDKFVPLAKAAVPILDLAVLRGVGIIEVLRTYNHVPFQLSDHLVRLKDSEKLLGFLPGPSAKLITAKVRAGLKRFRGEAVVKILVTGGMSNHLQLENRPGLYILFVPFLKRNTREYTHGTRLKSIIHTRNFPEAKSTSYLFAIVTHHQARKNGYHEILYKNQKGEILEGSSFNFAIVRNKTLITPLRGILRGVTMETVVELARRFGLKVARRAIKYSELKAADEAFTTSTLREIVPVVAVDKIKIGNGKPGKYSKELLRVFREYVLNYK